MSVNLQKGQKVDLTKGNAGLKGVMVGLGWDEATQSGGFFRGPKVDFDCDAIAFLLNGKGNLSSTRDIVFYNNLMHHSGAVIHQGDNLTGAGDGDDEQILVMLETLPAEIERVVIAVSIYDADNRGQHFGMINNAFIRIVDANTNREICRYDLTENYSGMKSMIFGELYRKNEEWKFNAIGQGIRSWSVIELAFMYGIPRTMWRG